MGDWFTQSEQFKRGKGVEEYLDGFFEAMGFSIQKTTPQEERQLYLGDRIFCKDGERYFVEYKSGIQTYYTGNVFLETVSVDDPASYRRGWIYTCQANYIIYAALLNGKILIFSPKVLRGQIEILKRQFREVRTSNDQNRGYNTHGLIVPLEYAEKYLASKVLYLKN